jgi:pimeloyl-ACP methyl ester carboxylesterase
MYTREWGEGRPVIALHPLALESSAFEGIARDLAGRGYRTIAADLPGFGKTAIPDGRGLSAPVLAEPVIELARQLEAPPAIIGISMGGRVALESAFQEPGAFSAVVPIAPYLPWRSWRPILELGRFLSPRAAEWIPLDRAWPLLSWMTRKAREIPLLREDELAKAAALAIYNFSCSATRGAFVSAAREMALDPAFGREGFWTRLADLAVPATFIWGERDWLVSKDLARPVSRTLPSARQVVIPCLGHALNGPHHRCLSEFVADLLDSSLGDTSPAGESPNADGADMIRVPCGRGGKSEPLTGLSEPEAI